ncbi:MAG TPA: penicillin-binding protein 2 [Frankiaceae bacterium]|nr:penicillin-binding protein 2 [Frankiaceae bacterium]
MNRPIRRVAVAALVLFGLLFLNVNYIQVVQADALRNNPRNNRLLLDEYSRPRGDIIAGRSTLVESKETDDRLRYLRVYAGGRDELASVFAPVTGYYSLVFGATGIERAHNDTLSGNDDRLFVRRLSDLLTGREPQGGSVVLTIDPEVQRAAAAALGGRRGAVVALDPKTGAVLAMVTSPSYDPNDLSSHDPEKIRAANKRLNADRNRPLLNRTAEEVYPPGSTFKVITAAAALEGGMKPSDQLPCSASIVLPDTRDVRLRNFGNSGCPSKVTLAEAMQKSYNTTFATLGMQVGADDLQEMAEKFGFNARPEFPLRTVASAFPQGLNRPQLAQSAIGQFDVRATPLQMAMVAATVANGGRLMRPYLVSEVLAPDLSSLEKTEPDEIRRAIGRDTAAALSSMMQAVVAAGTGTRAQIPGVPVAGKTGTAQNAGPSHAWFIGFAPANDPKVAVAVIVENGGGDDGATGGRVAAPLARQVMETALRERR